MTDRTLFRCTAILWVFALTACQNAAPALTSVVTAPGVSSPAQPATRTPRPTPVATALPISITLTSASFVADAEIPRHFVCPTYGGDEVSPALNWGDVPAGTKSLALTLLDPDAGQYVHWLVANIPVETVGFEEGQVPADAAVGWTTNGTTSYLGPCPEATHHYVFTLYALDVATELKPGFGWIDFQMAISGHVLGEGQLVGLFTP